MLTKDEINTLKTNGNGALSKYMNDNAKRNKNVLNILKHLGHLPNGFDGDFLLDLTTSENKDIRFWVVKNLGKFKNAKYIGILSKIAKSDIDTNVRREAVSSIGRMRDAKAQNFLISLIDDSDPKIICQAIRGLLVFKGDKKIDNVLKGLLNHENEFVRSIIEKEYVKDKIDKSTHLKHADTFEYLRNVVVNGDVLEVLKNIAEESIHLTFTSPPYYNARDYSIYPSYRKYLEFLSNVFEETYRITKEGRFLIVNTSPIIIPRISRQHSSKRYPIPFDLHHYLTEIGWEFIDDIIWLKPEASVKNRNAGFLQHRKPLGYKPNAITEYLMVYRKKTQKLLDWNIRQYDFKTVKDSKVADGYETSNVWRIDPKFDKVHSAVFPSELCRRVIEYYSFKGDLLFDPFGGSGTFGRTAKSLGRFFFLTEIDKRYFEYMKTFMDKNSMFTPNQTRFLKFEDFLNSIK